MRRHFKTLPPNILVLQLTSHRVALSCRIAEYLRWVTSVRQENRQGEVPVQDRALFGMSRLQIIRANSGPSDRCPCGEIELQSDAVGLTSQEMGGGRSSIKY